MEKKFKLTIAIPTYNRIGLLAENLDCLIPQLSDNVELIVIDNNSDSNPPDCYIDNHRVNFIKNVSNIGGNANILRCIEMARGEYVWILGDDDFPKSTSVSVVLRDLEMGAAWLNYHSDDNLQPVRPKEIFSRTLLDFLYSLSSINEIIFISNNVFKVDIIRAGLSLAYDNNNLMAPHVISMLQGCMVSGEGNGFYLSKYELFSSISNNNDKKTKWDLYKVYTGILFLPLLFQDGRVVNRITKLIKNDRSRWLSNYYLIGGLWELSCKHGFVKAFFVSSSFIFTSMRIDGFNWLVTMPIYFSSLATGKIFWSKKEIFKKLFK